MMISEGLNELRDLIATDIDKGQFRTGTTPAQIDDTGLETAVSATQVASIETSTSRQISSQVNLNSVLGNGSDLSEFALQRSSATAIDFTRDIFTAITKADTFELRAIKTIFIDTLQQA